MNKGTVFIPQLKKRKNSETKHCTSDCLLEQPVTIYLQLNLPPYSSDTEMRNTVTTSLFIIVGSKGA